MTSEIMLTGTRLLLTPAKRPEARQLNVTLEPDQYFTRPRAAATWPPSAPQPSSI